MLDSIRFLLVLVVWSLWNSERKIFCHRSDEAPGMLKQFLDVVVVPIAMKEMTQEFEQGVSKMSALWVLMCGIFSQQT